MKIDKLIIYGFGKHENVRISLDPGMTVLYGMNEAGKTTIQQFILHVLFGFPPRNSTILRYEPKSGGKYGGQIVVRDEKFGVCTIERTQGKSAGDVTVYFSDGTTGGEEALSSLLRQYDRASFESIFSFSLLQLQGFEKMDEEELSRTLLASGTMGVDSLLQIEKKMEKDMGQLFKKSGRNPEMNVKLKELAELELALKEETEKIAQYEPTVQRIADIEEKLTQLATEEKVERDVYQQLSLLRQYMPIYEKKAELEKNVKLIEQREFPTDGIRRFESLDGKLSEAKALKRRLSEEIRELEVQLSKADSMDQIAELELFLAKETEWHGWVSQVSFLTEETKRLIGMKHRLFDRLGMKVQDEEVLLLADVSIRKEEEMFEVINEMELVDKQLDSVQSQFENVEKDSQEVQMKLQRIKEPTIEEIKRVEEWPTIRQQLAEAKAYQTFTKRETKERITIPVIVFILSFICLGFGLIQQQWLVVISGVLLAGIGIVLLRNKASINNLKDKEMKQFILKYESQESEMEQLTSRISTYHFEKDQLGEQIESNTAKLEKYTIELNDLNSEREQVSLLYESFIHNYGFDGLPTPHIVPQLFRMIREIQEIERDQIEKEREKSVNEKNIAQQLTDIETILKRAVPQDALYEIVRLEHMKLKEVTERNKIVTERLSRLNSQLKETLLFIEEISNQLSILKEEANAETAEDFYQAYDIFKQGIRYKEQLADVLNQLELSGCLELLETSSLGNLGEREAEGKVKLAAVDEQVSLLMNEKAQLVNETESLLTDEKYGERLQFFEMKKAELAELAKKWSVQKAVAETIHQTMMALKDDKLPDVLKSAEQLFCELTGGAYESLQVTEQGFFLAVASNGMRYPIIELSQATKEQAYISLRLALASSVLESAPFPIIMDDPFVHFDEERLSRMIKLLAELPTHQFIYFTCHKKMKDKWADAKIINVSEIGNDKKEFVE